ncbi:sugar phosphate isomerase/epimerase family protein [Brevibacillus sp. TJ4]|uniref:sugar phosphate isomerase/epimerase family protein n=1 Tax=Brevibacillus sp. TJ4 TaxID=3234853 RepID=UPI003BA09440
MAYLTVFGCSPPEMTYIAARTGYDFVSFRPIPLGTPNEPKYLLAEDKALLKDTKAALGETGIRLLDVELARIYDGVDLQSYIPAMEAAAELGGRHIITSGWSNERNFLVDSYAELCEMAKPYGLTVDFEFVYWSSVPTIGEALDIIRSANSDNAGLLIDTLHWYAVGGNLDELDAVSDEWLHFTHINDAPTELPTTQEEWIRIGREQRLYIGEGGVDLRGLVQRLPEIPYSIEIPNLRRAQELGYEEYARRCLRTAKAVIDQQQ